MIAHGYFVLVFIAMIAAGANIAPDAINDFEHIHTKQVISRERELANRMLHRLMDVAYETFKDLGGSEIELKEMEHKRARITTCYFQAISCY